MVGFLSAEAIISGVMFRARGVQPTSSSWGRAVASGCGWREGGEGGAKGDGAGSHVSVTGHGLRVEGSPIDQVYHISEIS